MSPSNTNGYLKSKATAASRLIVWIGATALAHATLLRLDAAAPTNTSFGISPGYVLNWTTPDLNTLFDQIGATGVKYIRLDLPWGEVQAGGSGTFTWTNVDRVYDLAISKGFKVLPVTTGIPGWAATTGSKAGYSIPVNSTVYYDFLFEAGLQLMPKGITEIELWNEANIQGFTAANYTTRVLMPGANGWRDAATALGSPSTVLTSGLSNSATSGGNFSPYEYLADIYANGGKNYFDILNWHPYTFPHDPSIPSFWNAIARTEEMRATMVANGDSAKPIWATELGYVTGGPGAVTEAQQSDYMLKAYAEWDSLNYTGPYMWFRYKDTCTDPNNLLCWYGLVRADGSNKPVFTTFNNAVANFPSTGGGTVVTPRTNQVGGTYFAPQTVTLSTPTAGATIYYTTNGATPTASSSVYSSPLSISITTTIKTMATKSGMAQSPVWERKFIISGVLNQYEAEDNVLRGAGVAVVNDANASGGQAVGNFTANGGLCQINTIDGSSGGAATLVVRYSNGSGSSKTLSRRVNRDAAGLTFPATASWSTFSTVTINSTLEAGRINTLQLEKNSADSGNVIIDRINVTPTGGGSGLVAYWKFDETSGTTAFDSSGNGHHGTLTSGGAFAVGKKATPSASTVPTTG